MDTTLERMDAVESIQSAQSMQAMYLKQPMEMISELKAFARECVVGIPVEIGLGESREAGVFMIDRTLRTAHGPVKADEAALPCSALQMVCGRARGPPRPR